MVFKNADIYTMDHKNPHIADGYIRTENGVITAVGKMKDYQKRQDETERDMKGRILMPGMMTTHSHFYAQFVRGIMADLKPVTNWPQTLTRLWWRLDEKLTPEQNYYSAMLGMIEGVKAGTTLYFDHQASPGAIDGSLDLLEKAAREVGVRAALAYEVTDRGGSEGAKAGIHENVRFIKKMKQNTDDTVRGMFGLHAIYSVGEETLEACAKEGAAINAGFHIHIAEGYEDVAECYRRYDESVVSRLLRAGILNDHSIAAHGVFVTEEEMELLRDCGVTVAYNAQSNTNSGVGIVPVVPMLNKGVHVALGGDGYSADMFRELSVACMLQRLKSGRPCEFTTEQTYQVAFDNPGRLAEKIFGRKTGVLKEGAYADFIAVDYDAPTPICADNFLGHMLAAFSGKVAMTVINGKVVCENGKCTFVDEEKIFAECRKQAEILWKSIGQE